MKIMVIGYSGSGKSTLAKQLAHFYQLPLLYIDTLQFEPNWIERSVEDRNQDLLDFINTHENWVIDGNYKGAHFDLRVSLADQIYILNYNRFTCLINAIKRRIVYKNKSRESITSGCYEKLDWEFLKWLLYQGRSKRRKTLYQTLKKTYSNKVFMFRNRRQLNHYLLKKEIISSVKDWKR
ncbi:MAG: topology modulation protein [Tenericutes bacterium]|nr:topology modulation protein [Mycoplasmatota bacterium]